MKRADEIVARTADERVEDDRRLAANDLVDDVVDRVIARGIRQRLGHDRLSGSSCLGRGLRRESPGDRGALPPSPGE